jgi:hypothetical protein
VEGETIFPLLGALEEGERSRYSARKQGDTSEYPSAKPRPSVSQGDRRASSGMRMQPIWHNVRCVPVQYSRSPASHLAPLGRLWALLSSPACALLDRALGEFGLARNDISVPNAVKLSEWARQIGEARRLAAHLPAVRLAVRLWQIDVSPACASRRSHEMNRPGPWRFCDCNRRRQAGSTAPTAFRVVDRHRTEASLCLKDGCLRRCMRHREQ